MENSNTFHQKRQKEVEEKDKRTESKTDEYTVEGSRLLLVVVRRKRKGGGKGNI